MNRLPLRIKFLSKVNTDIWLHQFPDNTPSLNNYQFIFDQEETDYDWLVVYDDLPSSKKERFPVSEEQLACHPDNTVLITIEPSSVKVYGNNYTNQFGHVITSQPYYSLPHRSRFYSQPSLYWFYGVGRNKMKNYNEMVKTYRFDKTGDLSVVWSNKKQKHTLHHQRHAFLSFIKKQYPDIEIFGSGGIKMDDKAEALDKYKYHLAIENHYGLHHWTEKLADSFLGQALPFYYGCPNINDYFPNDSYISIDIFQPEKSLEIIQSAMENNEYEKRLETIIEAKNILIDKYNIFIVLAELFDKNTKKQLHQSNNTIRSRRAANRKNIFSLCQYSIQKLSVRTTSFAKNYLGKQPSSI